MNNLYGTRTYLVGAMDRVKDGGVEWRDRIIPHLHKDGVMVYNPCNKPIHNHAVEEGPEMRAEIKRLKKIGNFAAIKDTYGSVRTVDLRMVDTADFIIANIDIDVHACGTYEEIVTANRQKKPVLVHCEQGYEGIPNWLAMMLPWQHLFDSWNCLLDHLDNVNEHGDDGTGRWVFFDMSEEISAIQQYHPHKEEIL